MTQTYAGASPETRRAIFELIKRCAADVFKREPKLYMSESAQETATYLVAANILTPNWRDNKQATPSYGVIADSAGLHTRYPVQSRIGGFRKRPPAGTKFAAKVQELEKCVRSKLPTLKL